MNIQPVSTFYNGQTVDLTQLIATLVWDNLQDQAVFYWELCSTDDSVCQTGNLQMSGQAYTDWNTSTGINTAAYEWIAQQLNVTII